MTLTKRISVSFLMLSVAAGFQPVSAQGGVSGGGLGVYGLGPRLGENVELALKLQDQLGLSSEQVAALEAVQTGMSRDVAPMRAELDLLRGRIIAGEPSRIDDLLQLQDLLRAVAAPYRVEMANILTTEQHLSLQTMMFNTSPWAGRGVQGVGVGLRQSTGLGTGRGPGRGLGLGAVPGLGRGIGRGAGRRMASPGFWPRGRGWR